MVFRIYVPPKPILLYIYYTVGAFGVRIPLYERSFSAENA